MRRGLPPAALILTVLGALLAGGCDADRPGAAPLPGTTPAAGRPAEAPGQAADGTPAGSLPDTSQPDTSLPGPAAHRPLEPRAAAEPDRIVVQLLIVGHRGSTPPAARSSRDALELASDLLAQVTAGADFSELVTLYSDDATAAEVDPPGALRLRNHRVAAAEVDDEAERAAIWDEVAATAFALGRDDVGFVDWSAEGCPAGYVLVRRLR